MRFLKLSCVTTILALGILNGQIFANPVANSVLREALEAVIRNEGRSAMSRTGMEALEKTMIKYAPMHGPEAIAKLTTTGGTNFLRGLERFKGEFLDVAVKLSDDGVKVLSRKCDQMMPLARKFGPEIIELEAKAPGTHSSIIKNYGPESIEVFARKIPGPDIARLLQVGERAKDKTTRDLILTTYGKEGRSFLEKIPPRLVIAIGAGGGLVYIGKGIGDGVSKAGSGVEKGISEIGKGAGEYAKHSLHWITLGAGFFFAASLAILAWIALPKYLTHRQELRRMDSQDDQETTPSRSL